MNEYKSAYTFLILVVLLFLIGTVFTIFEVKKQRNEFEEFIKQQNCKITAHFNKRGIEATGWLCDDGITYYR